MVGAMEKGIAAAEISRPPKGSYDGVDLRILPKYISFRAALLQSKLTYQYINLGLAAVLLVVFLTSRVEVNSLYTKLREKEYILAPGVQVTTPAAVNEVTIDYVEGAARDYLGMLGNFTAGSINDQYRSISELMSPQLRVRFLAESADFVNKVKVDNISELLTVTQMQSEGDDKGSGQFRITAMARRDTYVNNEYLGHLDEIIQMRLQLLAPKPGMKWFLQIIELKRSTATAFRSEKSYPAGH